mmetsp:Transcript_16344/g.41215  ORF Transcript_16344/g.41215 Transcript_16344/m.41215 type:complete len:490 (+) Transcript_16344:41-1510(+)
MPKRKGEGHPIDESGVLAAAKEGNWPLFGKTLTSASYLTFDDFNELPPGRTFGVVHQICYHGNLSALQQLLSRHPRVDLKLLTKTGQTPLQVAVAEGSSNEFLEFLRERVTLQTHQELVSAARDGEWPHFESLLNEPGITVDVLNTVPPGRTWGVIHQVSYWGDTAVLEKLITAHPNLNLVLETNEDASQVPTDIAIGRGNTAYAKFLQEAIAKKAPSSATSKVEAPSSAMKMPVSAEGKLCNICYMEDHEAGTMGVACDNDHFICQECFSQWVASETDIEANPQKIFENGGRVTCVCKMSSNCTSNAFANKLIAMVVPDELYERYLKARDYVVGKDAVAGALAKVKQSGGISGVEQEQIRNLYKKADGTYSAYMCGQCKFGPIDHGWCNDLSCHHGEGKGQTGQISNACPKCKWFAAQLGCWPRWDGEFREGGGSSSAPPPVNSLSIAQLKHELKSRGYPTGGTKDVLMARLQQIYNQTYGATSKQSY